MQYLSEPISLLIRLWRTFRGFKSAIHPSRLPKSNSPASANTRQCTKPDRIRIAIVSLPTPTPTPRSNYRVRWPANRYRANSLSCKFSIRFCSALFCLLPLCILHLQMLLRPINRGSVQNIALRAVAFQRDDAVLRQRFKSIGVVATRGLRRLRLRSCAAEGRSSGRLTRIGPSRPRRLPVCRSGLAALRPICRTIRPVPV